ncbi:MAG TPA: TolC family protein [Thermoanaerobaculia bacterium]|nr:TolC family protein [Thermoanaerobaculia bacterium]
MIGLKSGFPGALLSATLLAFPASDALAQAPRAVEPAPTAGVTSSPPPASQPAPPPVPTEPPPTPPAPPAPEAAETPTAPGTLSLTRRQAIDEALAHNPGIAAADQQVAEARAQAVTAAAFADPTLSADTMGEPHPLDVGAGNITDLYVGFTIPFPGKRGMRRDVAVAAVRAAEFTLTQTRNQVASQTAQDYDALLVALRHRDDLRQSRQFSADFLAKTQARFAGGTAPKVDVVKAKVDLAQADNDLIANERTIDSARATLNRVLGRLGGAPLAVTQPLEVPGPLPDVETLERLAEATRPELLSIAAQRQGARTATRLAREFWAPDFTVTLARNAFEGGPTTYTSTLLIGFPIFFWQHEKGEVANARHRESELAANANDLRAQVSLDVRSAYATASTALRQAAFIRDDLLPEAREVYRVAALSYGLGATSALDLLDAKRTLVDAQRQFVDALGSANDAQAALELAVGAPLPPATPGGHP